MVERELAGAPLPRPWLPSHQPQTTVVSLCGVPSPPSPRFHHTRANASTFDQLTLCFKLCSERNELVQCMSTPLATSTLHHTRAIEVSEKVEPPTSTRNQLSRCCLGFWLYKRVQIFRFETKTIRSFYDGWLMRLTSACCRRHTAQLMCLIRLDCNLSHSSSSACILRKKRAKIARLLRLKLDYV